MYGIQTWIAYYYIKSSFENDVKMYGIQTVFTSFSFISLFENDVKMYGIQTRNNLQNHGNCLRMM